MISFNNINYTIETIGYRKVGERASLQSDTYNWNSNLSNPFKDLSHHRIYYIKSGSAELITNNGVISLMQGNMYYFPSNTIIASRCEDEMNHGFLHFSVNNSEDFFEYLNYSSCIKMTDNLINLFSIISESFEDKTASNSLKRDGAFRMLLAEFLVNATEIDKNMIKFNSVMQYIDNNLDKAISIAELAEITNLSVVYFSAVFKKTFKITPIKYIAQRKLLLAKRLLLNSNFTVKEVSEKCGFEQQYYFSNWFYSNTGIYPTTYKKQCNNAN